MNNVITGSFGQQSNTIPAIESPYNEASDLLHDAIANQFKEDKNPLESIFFPVKEQKLVTAEGVEIDSHKSIVRLDNNESIGIVGTDYKLVENEVLYSEFQEAIAKSDIKTDGMITKVNTSHNGARSYVDFIFPEYSTVVDSPVLNDTMRLKITVRNSYNGSSPFHSEVSADRLVCLNGMVIADRFATSYGKHTKHLDIKYAADKLRIAAENYQQNVAKWQEYSKINVDLDQAIAIIEKVNKSEKVQAEILKQFRIETKSLGFTKWALFNALTFYSSHMHSTRTRSSFNVPSAIVNKEKEVRTAINSKQWEALQVA
tara:strand:+ start:489 stop:1436 length:948 start_codon:yes stop_codon:yes gene_type:complete